MGGVGLSVGPRRDGVEAVDGGDGGIRAGGDDDVVARELPAGHLEATRCEQSGFSFEDEGALFRVAADLPGVIEVAGHVVAVVAGLCPVEAGSVGSLDTVDLAGGLGRAKHALAR